MKSKVLLKKLFVTFVSILMMVTTLTLSTAPAAAADTDGTDEFVERLYRSLLDRGADSSGRDYWAKQFRSGVAPAEMLIHFLATDEGKAKKPTIEDVYRRILRRAPDTNGLAYWKARPYEVAVVEITVSPEALDVWGHNEFAPVATVATAGPGPDGYVLTENGVWLPPVMLSIRFCESTDNYNANNTRSSASGAYQFIASTARATAKAAGRPDLVAYGDHVAGSWSRADQDRMALFLWQQQGTRPWYASRHCWG